MSSDTLKQISQNLTVSLTNLEYGGEPQHVIRVGRQDVEGQPLGTLRPDPGQSPELVDQILDRALVHA